MKAAVYKSYGPPDVLRISEVDTPSPKDNEILVKVFATTVNRTDCGILWGKPFIIRFFTGLTQPKKEIPGTDFAGIVEETGKSVKSFKARDKVWGFHDNGLQSKAEYLVIAENGPVTKIPENYSFEEAASSGEGAHYAYNFIKKVNLQPGDKVMVNGATGAIGSAMVQLLNYLGAKVWATANTTNLELIKSLGAQQVIDFNAEDFTHIDEKFDYVFDAVGKSSFSKCKRILKNNGIYISSELGPNNQNPFLAISTSLKGNNSKKVKFPFPSGCRESVLFIKNLMEEGKFRPVIDRMYPLEEIASAYDYVSTGKKTGNVVITI